MKEKGERPDRTKRKEGEEQKTGKKSMHKGRRLRRHLPWLALLLVGWLRELLFGRLDQKLGIFVENKLTFLH
jgi:hypothetical protein